MGSANDRHREQAVYGLTLAVGLVNILEVQIRMITCGCGHQATALDRDRAAAAMLDHITHSHGGDARLQSTDPVVDTKGTEHAE